MTTIRPLLAAAALAACTPTVEEPLTSAEIARAVCPQSLFDHAVCVCEDLAHVGELRVTPGPAGIGSVGVNGRTDLVTHAEVAGSWIAWGGFSSVGAAIGDSLVTPASVDLVGDVTIGGDAVIGGDLVALGRLAIEGRLALGGREQVLGDSAIAGRAAYAAPAAPPCGCDDASRFDVAQAVRAARQATNGESSWSSVGVQERHLATGSYYVTSADLVGETAIVVDGNVSVFVDGSLRSVGAASWKLGPSATLDLFVAGDVEHVGTLTAGDAARPDAFRLYVGGDGPTTVDTVGALAFYGSLYAPTAAIDYVGDAQIVGSIVARRIDSVGSLTVAYGEPVAPPASCDAPPGGPIL